MMIGSQLFIQEYILQIISKETQNILTQKVMPRITNNIIIRYLEQLNYNLIERAQSLIVVNNLYKTEFSTNYNFESDLDECNFFDEDQSQELIYIGNCYCFCYGLAGENQIYYDDKMIVSNLLSFTATIQQKYYQIYFASNTDDQFYAINPCFIMPIGWIPKERPWFQQHNQNISSIQISDIYLELAGGVCITLTKSLQNNQNQTTGIIANDITMNQFQLSDNEIVNFTLIDLNGQIIMSNLYNYNSTDIYYFYNTSILGYDEQDFEILLAFQNKLNYTNQCPFNIENTFCLFNKLKQKNIYLTLQNVFQNNYILIAEFDPNLYTDTMNSLQNEINQTKILYNIIMSMLLLFSLLMFLLSYCINTLVLQKPIEQLMQFANMKNTNTIIKKDKIIEYFFQNIDGKSYTINSMNEAFQKLRLLQKHKKTENNQFLRKRFQLYNEFIKQEKQMKSFLKQLKINEITNSNNQLKTLSELLSFQKYLERQQQNGIISTYFKFFIHIFKLYY